MESNGARVLGCRGPRLIGFRVPGDTAPEVPFSFTLQNHGG